MEIGAKLGHYEIMDRLGAGGAVSKTADELILLVAL